MRPISPRRTPGFPSRRRGYFLRRYEERANEARRVFVDGQNLYHAARTAFGYRVPNYDIGKLAAARLSIARLAAVIDPVLHRRSRIQRLSGNERFLARAISRDARRWHCRRRQKIALRPASARRRQRARKRDRCPHRVGCDARGLRRRMRCGGRFQPRSGLAEVAAEIRHVAATKNRRIEIACAYPQSEKSANRRGINNTDWIALDRAIYDSCLDARDYFPRAKKAAR